jgi:hypothetical protein
MMKNEGYMARGKTHLKKKKNRSLSGSAKSSESQVDPSGRAGFDNYA